MSSTYDDLGDWGYVNKILTTDYVDGPGNRLAIFFQGCNFNCRYCHNSETIHLCQQCPIPAPCTLACPHQRKECCLECHQCLKACPHQSSPLYKKYHLNQIEELLIRYRPFISGITLSGGEPTLQFPFLKNVLKIAKSLSLHTLLDTNGSLDPNLMLQLLPWLDGAMIDLKAWSDQAHLALTGQSNAHVLVNIENLAKRKKIFEVRTVLYQNSDDSKNDNLSAIDEEIKEISRFLILLPMPIPWKLIPVRS